MYSLLLRHSRRCRFVPRVSCCRSICTNTTPLRADSAAQHPAFQESSSSRNTSSINGSSSDNSTSTSSGGSSSSVNNKPAALTKTAIKLSDCLFKAIMEDQKMENSQLPPELVETKRDIETEWKLKYDGPTTEMFRETKGWKIEVTFSCIDVVAGTIPPTAEEKEKKLPPRKFMDSIFTVEAKREQQELLFHCVIEDSILLIHDLEMKNGDTRDLSSYHVMQRDERRKVYDYLKETLGINQEVLDYIELYNDFKQKRFYLQYLRDFKTWLVLE